MKIHSSYLFGLSLAFLHLGLNLSIATAATFYVDASALGPENDGTSWATAFPSIGEAIVAASTQDEIWVARGVYPGTFSIDKEISLYGGFAGTETERQESQPRLHPTILDAGGAERLLILSGASVLIEGFTLRNTDRIKGVAVSGGVYAVSVRRCFITQNGTGIAAGISACDSLQNVFAGNTIGITVGSQAASVVSNVFIGNITGISQPPFAARLHNNTFVGNDTGLEMSGGSAFANCIFAWNNTAVRTTGGLPRNCCFYGNGANVVGTADPTGYFNNKLADPRLVAAASGEIHLLPDSPCIDSGANTTSLSNMTDIDGTPRTQPSGGTVDIGADEYDGTLYTVTPRTVRVRPDGNDARDGQTWEDAKRTLSGALEASYGSGGEIWMAAGTYTGPITAYTDARILGHFDDSMEAARTGGMTVLDGDGGPAVLTLTSAGPTLVDGIRLRNGHAGANVLLGAPLLANCVLAGNIDGLAVDGGAPSLVNATLAGNWRGVAIYMGEPTIANSLIAFNGTGIERASSAAATPTIRHNNVHGNGVNYSGLDDPSGSKGNIDADPSLQGAATGDFHLTSDSPCRGTGDADIAAQIALDMDGEPRVREESIDIGADQFDTATVKPAPITIRVRANGDDANDGSSWEKAKRTITAALDAAESDGGAVWVAAGTYDGSLRARPFVALLGGFIGTESNPEDRDPRILASTLRASPGQTAVSISSGHRFGRLDGFHIADSPVGVACRSASADVTNNVFVNNGIALESMDGSPVVLDNEAAGNAEGMFLQGGSPVVARNRLEDTDGRAFAVWEGFPNVHDNLFARAGTGAAFVDGSGTFVNNTVAHNGTGIAFDAAQHLLANNIIAFNTSRGIHAYEATILPPMRNNDVYGGPVLYSGLADPTGQSGNLSSDPLFRAPSVSDYRLTVGSPCIDSGSSADVGWDTDLAGQPRLNGLAVDLGAFESVPPLFTVQDAIQALHIAGGMMDKDDALQDFDIITLPAAIGILRIAIGTD